MHGNLTGTTCKIICFITLRIFFFFGFIKLIVQTNKCHLLSVYNWIKLQLIVHSSCFELSHNKNNSDSIIDLESAKIIVLCYEMQCQKINKQIDGNINVSEAFNE